MANVMQMDSVMEKLTILSDAAKYDVACTSSGIQRGGDGKGMGNAHASGICHAFTGDGRCISLLKILFTNECIYDCKYCPSRAANEKERATFTPEEICKLVVEFYRRNYIEGLFLSSAVVKSPAYTMERMYEAIYMLRNKYHFNGYIHVKAIPGAPDDIIYALGFLVDRMSVNLELPTSEGLRQIAPNKVRRNILSPMRQIQNGIEESRHHHGVTSMKSRVYIDEKSYYNQMAEIRDSYDRLLDYQKGVAAIGQKKAAEVAEKNWSLQSVPQSEKRPGLAHPDRYFVPAGQSTQMIIGATGETDYQIMAVSEALYQRFAMKRVFYSAFINVNQDSALPETVDGPPLLREHRLYQADFLLRFYGFQTDELLSEKHPNFNELIDPKCDWAVHHLEQFPVEINRADYYTLLRVPGIGTKSAKRILAARRFAALDFADIKKMGVVLKRAIYFITCKGRMMYPTKIEEGYITRHLIYNEKPAQMLLADGSSVGYEQMTLQDYMDQRKEGE